MEDREIAGLRLLAATQLQTRETSRGKNLIKSYCMGKNNKTQKAKNTQTKTSEEEKPKWSVDESKVDEHPAGLQKSEQDKYDDFKRHVGSGMHPKEAAAAAGVKPYKNLQGNQFQGKLGKKERFTTFHDEHDPKHPVLRIHQLGGHS
jgi:hypothetical protein